MSTKTTFKRVALVAVASLSFGVLTSIAPASANGGATTFVSVGTNATNTGAPATPIASGTAATFNLQIASTAATTVAGNAIGVNFTVTAGALALDITSTCTFTAVQVAEGAGVGDGSITSVITTAATGSFGITVTAAGAAAVSSATIGTASCPTTIGGLYEVTATVNAAPVASNLTFAATAPTTVATGEVNVSGVNVSQGTTRSTTVGAARVGGAANVIFTAPTRVANLQVFTVTSSGVGTIQNISQVANATIARVNGSAADYSAGGTVVSTAGDNTTLVSVNIAAASSVAGLQTISTWTTDATTGIQTLFRTATITWGATPTVSSSLTTVFAAGGNARAVALETTVLRLPSTAGVTMTTVGTTGVSIAITALDGDGANLNAQSVAATITGPGLLSITSGNVAAVAGTARSVSLTAAAQAAAHQSTIGVSGDGTRGVGTITITVGGTAVYTKTVTFHGAVATLTATQGVSVMRSGRTATSAVADFTLGGATATATATASLAMDTATNISIVAKDVDGNTVPLAAGAVVADISDSAVITAVNIAACANTNLSTSVCAAGDGTWIANTIAAVGGVSGAASTVTFKTAHPTVAGTFISTAALPFTLGGSALGGTVTMTFDKSTYLPGERMMITYTAKDAAGNPVRDWAGVGTPASNKAINGLNGAGIFVKGSHIYGDGSTELTYAPTAPGAFTWTLATGTATGAVITATATVSDDAATEAAAAAGDAAAEATDAANAATDAANAAAEAADAATAAAQDAADAVAALSTSVTAMVADLRKQITSLTNLVIKIQKKVKA
jgi:trimeric autotransporter adhesin